MSVFCRDAELARLQSLFADALAGRGRVHFIAGEAGSGKSALIEAFVANAQAASDDVLATLTTCDSQTGSADAYLPFLETLAQLTGESDRFQSRTINSTNASRVRGALSITTQAIIEEVPDLIGNFIPGGGVIFHALRISAEKAGWLDKLESARRHTRMEGKIEAEKIFQLYTELLLGLSKHIPLILVFDDLHWVDSPSAQLLFHVARRIDKAKILLLGAYRPNDIELGRNGERHPMATVINELKRVHGDIVLPLGGETPEQRRAMADAMIDAEPNELDDEFRVAFFELTRGHPLFSSELLRSLREQGTLLQGDDGVWRQQGDIDWQRLPPRVEGVIEERINRLEPALQETATLASVQGQSFLTGVVCAMQDIDDRSLLRTLSRELEDRHALVVEGDTLRINQQRVTRFHFAHNLFQQYLYDAISRGERMYLHADVGDALERLYAERRDSVALQLAHHFSRAEEWDRAVPYFITAAKRALKLSSYESALDFLNTALEHVDALPAEHIEAERLEILLAMGGVQQALKGFTHPDVEAVFAQAATLASTASQPILAASALYGLWTAALFRLQLQEAEALGEQIRDIGVNQDEPVARLIASRALANGYYQEGRLAETAEHARQVIGQYEAERIEEYLLLLTYDPKIFCLGLLAWAQALLGELDAAATSRQQMFEAAEELNHPISTCVAHLCALKLAYNLRDMDRVREHATALGEIGREYGFSWYAACGDLFACWAHAMALGEDAGAAEAEALERIYHEGVAPDGNLIFHSQFCRMIAELLLEKAQFAEALSWAERGIRVAKEQREAVYVAELQRIRGLACASLGDDTAAADALRQALDRAGAGQERLFELRIHSSICAGAGPNAAESADALARLLATFGTTSDSEDLRAARKLLP